MAGELKAPRKPEAAKTSGSKTKTANRKGRAATVNARGRSTTTHGKKHKGGRPASPRSRRKGVDIDNPAASKRRRKQPTIVASAPASHSASPNIIVLPAPAPVYEYDPLNPPPTTPVPPSAVSATVPSLIQQCTTATTRATRSLERAKTLWNNAPRPGSLVSLVLGSNHHHGSNSTSMSVLRMGHSQYSATAEAAQKPSTANDATTGGHSNSDHVIVMTGNPEADRIAELQRQRLRRQRQQQPESKGRERWNKPRAVGQRRRRIVRDLDLPSAPPEPVPSGYIVFVHQMTTKLRHDRGPDVPHHQPTVVQGIAKLWRDGMTDAQRQYYNEFAGEARREYGRQQMEYRATGQYTPSQTFERLHGHGPWVRRQWHERNDLEKEISQYPSIEFPVRPPAEDPRYALREKRSKVKRKLKMHGKFAGKSEDEIEQLVDDALEELLQKEQAEEQKDQQELDREEEEMNMLTSSGAQDHVDELRVEDENGNDAEETIATHLEAV